MNSVNDNNYLMAIDLFIIFTNFEDRRKHAKNIADGETQTRVPPEHEDEYIKSPREIKVTDIGVVLCRSTNSEKRIIVRKPS